MKKFFLPVLAAVLSITAGTACADDWICSCGCGDPVCINIAGECYKTNGTQNFNERGSFEYEDIANENGTITRTENGTVIDNKRKNLSWTYFFKIPPRARHYLHWNADLEVVSIEGANWAGVTMEGDGGGVIFRVNRSGKAQLVSLRNNVNTTPIEDFFLPSEIAKKTRGAFTMTIEYDVRTSVLAAKIDGTTVKRVTLPYYGIPAFVSTVGFSMETTNVNHSSDGTVTFGDFNAQGGNEFFPDTLL